MDALRLARAVLVAACAGAAALAGAQDYPREPVRLIVPYPPGGSTDVIARLYAEGLGKELGQPIVVDNRPGASTNIGSEAVARAKPDGYTVLFGGGGPTLNSVFGPKPSFDPMTGLDAVSMIARVPFMVAANPRVPFGNVREMVSTVRAAPGKYSISSAQLNVYVELMKERAGTDILHVPYKGGAQAATDAVAGQVDMVYALVPVLLPQVQSGKLKAIGVSSARRLTAVLPDVSTFAEAGVDYDIGTWYALQVPPGTPAPVVARLARATRAIVAQPAFVERLTAIGAEAVASTPAEMRRQMQQQQAVWTRLAKAVPSLVIAEPTR